MKITLERNDSYIGIPELITIRSDAYIKDFRASNQVFPILDALIGNNLKIEFEVKATPYEADRSNGIPGERRFKNTL